MKRLILPASILLLLVLVRMFGGDETEVSIEGTAIKINILRRLSEAGFLLCAAWFAKRTVELVITSLWRREGVAPKFVSDIVGVILFAGAILSIISFVLNKPVAGLLATSGLVVAILGFALQSTFSNIFSGMALNIARPFRMGHWLNFESGETGKVVEFNWRETQLETIEGRMIIIPNGMMADKKFVNLNAPERYYRIKLPIYVDYSAPTDRVFSILEGAIKATDGLTTERPSVVLLEDFDQRGVKYTLNYWVPNYPESFPITNQLMMNTLNHLNQAGLAPAYPKADIMISETPIHEIKRKLDVTSLLRRVELFQTLDEKSLIQLEKVAHISDFDTDTVIVRQDDEGDSLFVIVSGLLEVSQTDDGRRRALARLSPGEIFGEMSLLTGEPRIATVQAVTPVKLLEVRRSHLKPILTENPDLISYISEIQTKRQAANLSLSQLSDGEQNKTPDDRKASLMGRIKRFFQLS